MGTLVFMDSITHEILIWKHIQTERVDDYKYLLVELLNLGYTILSVTIDVKRGVNSVFAYAGTIRTASRFTSGHSAGVDSDS